ncbi:xanthine dehydrogenase accessory protein XdhC [Bosea caraganae]|uniref:Xanthine dehydrogenase accessory protein XdhC n=1 Tax=Bosea caraganae TaxID=2763117 RepID=A0A370L3L8_9HYPH|nr:xanthine dehydrogenase accessory protein XdhC [Bosea caraganae]RDJ23042.1 xanthine dehydrogenase accessory protein XdhC [Bosea caraganae]RDJ28822.1 xanthine dehydrogenase accessory protein XdhC [Bosea caraganae]
MTSLSAFLDMHLSEGAILVRIETAEGSTPREAGATMIVMAKASAGTIGGGQLEFHCLDIAREMLASGKAARILDIPLGPQMGQCCGGRVRVTLEQATPVHVESLRAAEAEHQAARPAVLIFGAGHTGRALAETLARLPFAVTLIDDRDDQMDGLPAGIACLRLDDPAEMINDAPRGAAFIILTHSHALDYRLAEAALLRSDAAYVGMIGSATKRARFAASFRRRHPASPALAGLTCPIGGDDVDDKRPEVIAALTAAELVRCLLAHRQASELDRKRSGRKGWG